MTPFKYLKGKNTKIIYSEEKVSPFMKLETQKSEMKNSLNH